MFKGTTNFNQCLSSWAGKTPTNVNLGYMFSSSGCLDKDSGGEYYQDFTPTELDTNSRDAKSKYDTQTYCRWKRAKKKAK